MTKEIIGTTLKNARNAAGLAPSEVVLRLKECGIEISEKTLYGYENGHSSPQIATLFRLCEFYGIEDVSGTFGFESKKNPATNNGDGLSAEDSLFSSLSPQGQNEALNYMRFLKDKEASK